MWSLASDFRDLLTRNYLHCTCEQGLRAAAPVSYDLPSHLIGWTLVSWLVGRSFLKATLIIKIYNATYSVTLLHIFSSSQRFSNIKEVATIKKKPVCPNYCLLVPWF